jgi:hypothetical protein
VRILARSAGSIPGVRRLVPVVVFLALAGSGCSGPAEPDLSPPATTGTTTAGTTRTASPRPTTPSPSVTPSPVVDPDVRLPEGMQAIVDDPADIALIAAGDFTALVPPDASPANASVLVTPADPIDQIALTWLVEEASGRRSGLIVWQRSEDPPLWRAVYAFTDPARKGVFGIRTDTGEVTGDGIADLVSFEDVGGSGACGTYRVIASALGDATQIFRRDTCDTQIAISRGDLRVREAVYRPDDPHCCPSAFRTTVLRWDGTAWEELSSEVVATDPSGR